MNKHVLACLLSAALAGAALSGCSGEPSRATCFECTTTPQKWSDFGFTKLEGTWRGTQRVTSNDAESGKGITAKNKPVEITFLEGHKFLRAYGIADTACGEFPAESVVLLSELWWDRASAQPNDEHVFQVFGRMSNDEVSFGRAYVRTADAGNTCEYSSTGKPITMNRLALPAVAYSRRVTSDGRALASGEATKEMDVNLEFLNFDDAKSAGEYRYKGKLEKEAPLFLRFVKTTRETRGAFDEGDWKATEEKLFRLWKVN